MGNWKAISPHPPHFKGTAMFYPNLHFWTEIYSVNREAEVQQSSTPVEFNNKVATKIWDNISVFSIIS